MLNDNYIVSLCEVVSTTITYRNVSTLETYLYGLSSGTGGIPGLGLIHGRGFELTHGGGDHSHGI